MIEVSNLSYAIPGGRVLFRDVTFRVPHRSHVALVGANGAGKTTLFRLIEGAEAPKEGFIRVEGRLAVMDQFIGRGDKVLTVREFLESLASGPVRSAAKSLRAAEAAAAGEDTEGAHMRYADALADWAEVGGYETEVLWDTCTTSAFGMRLEDVGDRALATLSGGEQKRLALETLFRSDADVLLLDEPDNFLDVPRKTWLDETMNASPKTILYVSHDRELLARTSTRVVTLEAHGAWVHPHSYRSYQEGREQRLVRQDTERRLYTDEHARLTAMMKEFKRRAALNPKFATRAKSVESRIERFEKDNAPAERVSEQDIKMRLGGGRTGKIALRIEDLAFPDLVEPFSTEIYFGERVGILGPNGTGKSHFVRLLAGEAVVHTGTWRLGARVTPDLFSQTHDHPELGDTPILEHLRARGLSIGSAMTGLKRYELHPAASSPFSSLSGGQQARFQILCLELDNPTMLLLDEPTDNLDVDSAEALEVGLAGYTGTVITVTHDRWFMRLLDRFLIFDAAGRVTEALESPY